MSPESWRKFLQAALRGRMTLSEFETRFMRTWAETRARGERNPKVVEDLFHYVKNFRSEPGRLAPGARPVDENTLRAALRRTHSQLAPKGALGLMRSWFAILPLLMVLLTGVGSAQDLEIAPAPAPVAAPNAIAALEGCVRTRSQQLEVSREAADLVAVAAIQKCSRELTAATMAGQPRSLAEARQQLKDAMREIAITEVVDIRTARNAPPKVEPAKPAPRRPVRRRAATPAPKPANPAP